MEKLEKRLSHLEKQTYLWRSGISVLVGVGTFLGTLFPHLCELLLRR